MLLILAAVAINLTIGENGIFTRAQNATEKWKEAEANERQELDKAAEIIDEYLNGNKPKEGTLLAMYYKALEDKCTNADGSCQRADHLHVGDYVDFKNPTTGNATAETKDTGYESAQHYTINSGRNQLNWRVLGFDKETGGIKLIAGTPLKANGNDGYLLMGGAQSYVTGYLVPDQISEKLYGSQPYVEKARSVKIEDINEIMEIETPDDIRKYNLNPVLNGGYNYNDSYSIEDAYTPESYLAEKAAGEPEGTRAGTISGTVDGYYYTVNGEKEEGAPYVTQENQRIYNMLFNDTEYGSGGEYWLSSRGVAADSNRARFGPGAVFTKDGLDLAYSCCYMFYSDGREYGDGFGVRPVVSLESNVTNEQVPRILNKNENIAIEPYSVYDTASIQLKNNITGEALPITGRVIVEYEDGIVFDGNASELYNDKEDGEYLINLYKIDEWYGYNGQATVTIYYNDIQYTWEGRIIRPM